MLNAAATISHINVCCRKSRFAGSSTLNRTRFPEAPTSKESGVTMIKTTNTFFEQVRQRAIRMVLHHEGEHTCPSDLHQPGLVGDSEKPSGSTLGAAIAIWSLI